MRRVMIPLPEEVGVEAFHLLPLRTERAPVPVIRPMSALFAEAAVEEIKSEIISNGYNLFNLLNLDFVELNVFLI